MPPTRSKAAATDPEHAPAPVIPVIAQPGLAGFGFGCNASFDNCCTPGSSIYSRIFSFPAHTDTVHTYVCMHVCASAKGHDCHSMCDCCCYLKSVSFSLLISTFFGNFPLLSFLLSCRLSSLEVTKNALKTGSRVANTHPSLTPSLTHTLSQASTHSLVPVTNHLPKLKLKSRLVSPQIPLQLIVNCDMRGIESERHTPINTCTQFHSPPAPFYTFAVPLQRTKLLIERALARTHTHTYTDAAKQHVSHSHMGAFTLS